MGKERALFLDYTEVKANLAEAKEEIDNLSLLLEEKEGPSKREQELEKKNGDLQEQLYSMQFQSIERSHAMQQRQEMERRCMDYESEIGKLLRFMETSHNDMKRSLLDKERSLKVAKDAADEASGAATELRIYMDRTSRAYERRLMECEDGLTWAAEFKEYLMKAAAKVHCNIAASAFYA